MKSAGHDSTQFHIEVYVDNLITCFLPTHQLLVMIWSIQVFNPNPINAGVIVVPGAILAAAGIKFVGVPQPKPMYGFSANFQYMFTSRGSRAG